MSFISTAFTSLDSSSGSLVTNQLINNEVTATATVTGGGVQPNSPSAIINEVTSTGYYTNKSGSTQDASFASALGDGLNKGLLASLPYGFKTDVQQIADFQLGSFLGRHGAVSGSTASLINGVIDFIKSGNNSFGADYVINNVKKFDITKKFIPIILKTEFNLQGTSSSTGTPLYIVFQSTPESISFSKGASWNAKEFFGRPEPVQIYSSSGAISFSLHGRFFANSATSLTQNLDLEKQLFALVTPSKHHFMPSPVYVTIGHWKTMRCITTNISIDFQGPWYIPTGMNFKLPAHSPYVYDVTFNFTITSKANTVQYAEDLVDYGFNGGVPQTTADQTKLTESGSLIQQAGSKGMAGMADDLYAGESYMVYDAVTNEVTYTVSGVPGQSGTVINSAAYTDSSLYFNTSEYLKSLGLPTDSNNALKSAGLGQITSGLSGIIQTTINKNYGPKITKMLGS